MRALLAALAVLLSAPAAAGASLTYEKNTGGSHPTIWVAHDDGTHPIKVATGGDFPVIAPDGSAVAYASRLSISGDSSLRVALAPGVSGIERRLATHLRDPNQIEWSPDSTRIAAVVGPEIGPNRLIVINVASDVRKTVARGYIQGVSWSPDGTRLVYGSAPSGRTYPYKSDLHIVAATGGTATALTHDQHSQYPVWGPKTIVFSRLHAAKRKDDSPKSNLFTINPDGSGLRQLTHETVPYLLFGLQPLAFSADGSRLLGEYGGQDTSFGQTVNPVTGATRTIGPRRTNCIGFAISKDGSTILAGRGEYDPGGPHAVVTIPYAGGTPKVIVRNAFNATWTR